MTEDKTEEKASKKKGPTKEPKKGPKKGSWQIAAVIAVLVVFIVGSIILSEWRSFFGESAVLDSIAVLPFENVSQDGYAGSLADNLTESLIRDISQNSRLKVISRGEVFRYKGKNEDPSTIGKALKVRTVLTGRVMREGDNLVIKAELIEVEKKSQLWAKQYSTPVAEVMKLPADISREVIAAISKP